MDTLYGNKLWYLETDTYSKFLSSEVSGVIDMRVLNTQENLSREDILSNVNLLLNAAAMLGCDVSNIKPEYFLEENVCEYFFHF